MSKAKNQTVSLFSIPAGWPFLFNHLSLRDNGVKETGGQTVEATVRSPATTEYTNMLCRNYQLHGSGKLSTNAKNWQRGANAGGKKWKPSKKCHA